jgi:hypothetical protein
VARYWARLANSHGRAVGKGAYACKEGCPSFNLSVNSRALGPACALAYPAPAGLSVLLPSPG